MDRFGAFLESRFGPAKFFLFVLVAIIVLSLLVKEVAPMEARPAEMVADTIPAKDSATKVCSKVWRSIVSHDSSTLFWIVDPKTGWRSAQSFRTRDSTHARADSLYDFTIAERTVVSATPVKKCTIASTRTRAGFFFYRRVIIQIDPYPGGRMRTRLLIFCVTMVALALVVSCTGTSGKRCIPFCTGAERKVRKQHELPLENFSILPARASFREGDTIHFSVDEIGIDLGSPRIIWSSKNPRVLYVGEDGRGTALLHGEARVCGSIHYFVRDTTAAWGEAKYVVFGSGKERCQEYEVRNR